MNAVIRGISESDFTVLADAAQNAWDKGYKESALRLDVLARKANAALARASTKNLLVPGMRTASIGWREVPSTLSGKSGGDA